MVQNLFIHYLFFDGDFNFLWLFMIVALFSLGIIFLRRANDFKKKELKSTYQLNLGIGIFMIFYGITRICFIFSNFYSVYYNEQLIQFQIWIRIAYILSIFALAFLVFGLEKYFIPTKGIASIILVIFGILTIFLPYNVLRVIDYSVMPIYMIFIMSSYVYLAVKSSGIIRRNALISLLGLLLFFIGIFLDSKLFKVMFTGMGIRWVAYLIPFPIAIIGIFLFSWASTRKLN